MKPCLLKYSIICYLNFRELIESKEKTVEKFYNEDCSQDKNDAELSSISDNFQDEKNTSVNNDDNNYCDEGSSL